MALYVYIGLVKPVIAYLAAGFSPSAWVRRWVAWPRRGGARPTLGLAAGGWLFGAFAHHSYGWQTVPLPVMLGLLLARPRWWSMLPADAAGDFKRVGERADSKVST